MAAKEVRIDDVKRPGVAPPSTTSRPIVVTNRPTMQNDPMMAPAEEQPEQRPAMTHGPRIIQPLQASTKPDDDTADEPVDIKPDDPESKTESVSPPPKPEVAASVPTVTELDGDRDTEASVSAEEVAQAETKARRDQELEQLIESGTYAVPIDAAQRKRSQMMTTALACIVLILFVAVVDVLADVGTITLPSSIPHTHVFTTK